MLTYKEFEHFMKDVVNHIKLSEDIELLCAKYDVERGVSYPELDYDVIMLLEKLMEDDSEWIDYWVFELHCGEKYKDECVMMGDKSVKLKTIQDLYDFLSKNANKSKNAEK